MFSLTISGWIYVFSVTFQLSGAVLLLIKYTFKNITDGIIENKIKENRVEGEMLIQGNTQPTPFEYTENILLNRSAFALIALGYLLGIFGENTGIKAVLFAWILILSFVVTTSFALFAKGKAAKKVD